MKYKKHLHKMRLKKFLNHGIDERVSKIYQKRLVTYGNECLLFEYGSPQVTHKSERYDYSQSDTGERRADSIARSRSNIYQILSANLEAGSYPGYLPSFVTFTYERNETSVSEAFKDFKYSMKKFKRKLGRSPQYLTVLEFQKRGAIHFHTIFFDIPFIPDSERVLLYRPDLKKANTVSFTFEDIWTHGGIKSKALKGVTNIAAYVTKYLTKETLDNRLFRQKVYTSSRGLKRPTLTYDEEEIENYLESKKSDVQKLSTTFEHQTLKKITKITYKI